MKPKTQSEVDRAFDEYNKEVIRLMGERALKAHVAGDIQAHKAARTRPKSMQKINNDALEYSKTYKKDLEKDGSTVINGRKKQWLKGYDKEEREEIARIIEEGIREGRPTGVKETGKGTFPKGSTAAELKKHFNSRKSHASTVARTETARIQNISRLNRYENLDYTHVRVLDNEGPNSCKACQRANGQIWTMEKARKNELEHPNCVRTFVPKRKKKKKKKKGK